MSAITNEMTQEVLLLPLLPQNKVITAQLAANAADDAEIVKTIGAAFIALNSAPDIKAQLPEHDNASQNTIAPYRFKNTEYTSLHELVRAWAQNWGDGKKEILSGRATAFFKTTLPELAAHCQTAEEHARAQNGRDDLVFWRLLYHLNPNMQIFYWKGRIYENLTALGHEMLENLWRNDTSRLEWYKSILSEKLLTIYTVLATPDNTPLKQAVTALENLYKLELDNCANFRKTLFLMAYLLSNHKILHIEGQKFGSIEDLSFYLQSLLNKSADTLSHFCHLIIDENSELNPQFEAWLIAHGKYNELADWRALMATA